MNLSIKDKINKTPHYLLTNYEKKNYETFSIGYSKNQFSNVPCVLLLYSNFLNGVNALSFENINF